jgi:hypothetical protein
MDVDVAAHAGVGPEAAIEALERAGLEKTAEFQHGVNFRDPSGEPVRLAFDASLRRTSDCCWAISRNLTRAGNGAALIKTTTCITYLI